MNQIQNHETDLSDLFQTLWDGKWIISMFVTLAVLLASAYLHLKDAVYESKLIYYVDTIPPFYNTNKALSDFQKKFYSARVFQDWKKNNDNVSLVFDDFSTTEVVDGFVLSKNQSQKLAILEYEGKGHSIILVKSKQLAILDDFFKYVHHINKILKDEYIVRSSEELKIIETRFKNLQSSDGKTIQSVLAIDRYVVSAEKGANVFSIQRPTIPKKISPKSSFTFVLSVILGVMVSLLFIIIRNEIAKRK